MVSDVRHGPAGRKGTFTKRPLQARGRPCRLRADEGAELRPAGGKPAETLVCPYEPQTPRSHVITTQMQLITEHLSYLFRPEDRDQSQPVDATLMSL